VLVRALAEVEVRNVVPRHGVLVSRELIPVIPGPGGTQPLESVELRAQVIAIHVSFSSCEDFPLSKVGVLSDLHVPIKPVREAHIVVVVLQLEPMERLRYRGAADLALASRRPVHSHERQEVRRRHVGTNGDVYILLVPTRFREIVRCLPDVDALREEAVAAVVRYVEAGPVDGHTVVVLRVVVALPTFTPEVADLAFAGVAVTRRNADTMRTPIRKPTVVDRSRLMKSTF